MAWEFHGPTVNFKRKQILWQLKAKRAMGDKRRRTPQWLSMMFGKVTNSLWGHLGSAARHLQRPKGPPLFR